MQTPQHDLADGFAIDRDVLRGRVVNWGVITLAFGICLSIWTRTWEVGWQARDTVQLILTLCAVPVILSRRKSPATYQTVVLIAACIVAAFAAVYSIGLMAGAILCLPISAVLVSLSYSRRVVIVFAVLSIIGLATLGAGFTSGYLQPDTSADVLLTSPSHWVTYILCLALFYLLACTTILAHRRKMTDMVIQATQQREDLRKTNGQLQEALSEIQTLRGILSTCQHCKRIRPPDRARGDSRSWIPIETYIGEHSAAEFSHGICPDCFRDLYGEEWPNSSGEEARA